MKQEEFVFELKQSVCLCLYLLGTASRPTSIEESKKLEIESYKLYNNDAYFHNHVEMFTDCIKIQCTEYVKKCLSSTSNKTVHVDQKQ